jgi:hypothetical protein
MLEFTTRYAPATSLPLSVKFSAVDVDTRADIYSLDVILDELLTGTMPSSAGS